MLKTNSKQPVPHHLWRWPARIWQRVHMGFAENDGKNYLEEVMLIQNGENVSSCVKGHYVLRKCFSGLCLPKDLVSNNGPQFVSTEFAVFYKIYSDPPYHLALNGAAERSVQIDSICASQQDNTKQYLTNNEQQTF